MYIIMASNKGEAAEAAYKLPGSYETLNKAREEVARRVRGSAQYIRRYEILKSVAVCELSMNAVWSFEDDA